MSLVVHTKGEGLAAMQFDPDLRFAFTKRRIWRQCAWAPFPEHFVRADGSEAGGTSVSTRLMERWLGGGKAGGGFRAEMSSHCICHWNPLLPSYTPCSADLFLLLDLST